jgi:hypothetical protein
VTLILGVKHVGVHYLWIVIVGADFLTTQMRIVWYAKVAVATQMANLFEAPTNRFRIDTMGSSEDALYFQIRYNGISVGHY